VTGQQETTSLVIRERKLSQTVIRLVRSVDTLYRNLSLLFIKQVHQEQVGDQLVLKMKTQT